MGGIELDRFMRETMLSMQHDTNDYIEQMIEMNGYYVAGQMAEQINALIRRRSDFLKQMAAASPIQKMMLDREFKANMPLLDMITLANLYPELKYMQVLDKDHEIIATTKHMIPDPVTPAENIRVVSKANGVAVASVSVPVRCASNAAGTLEMIIRRDEIEDIFNKTMTALPNLSTVCLVSEKGKVLLSPYNEPREYEYLLMQCKRRGYKPTLLKKTHVPYRSLVCAPVTPAKGIKWFIIMELTARLKRGNFL